MPFSALCDINRKLANVCDINPRLCVIHVNRVLHDNFYIVSYISPRSLHISPRAARKYLIKHHHHTYEIKYLYHTPISGNIRMLYQTPFRISSAIMTYCLVCTVQLRSSSMTSNSNVDVNLVCKQLAQKIQRSLLKMEYLNTERSVNNNHSSHNVLVDFFFL